MGHVNNAVYFTYFEQARIVAYDKLGLGRVLEDCGLGLILVHGSCDYKAPVKFGDVVDVRITIGSIGRSSFALEYEARRLKDEAVVALGKSVSAVFDYGVEKTTPIPDALRMKLEALVASSTIAQ